ncbi:MAG: stage III sporulation protein AC [Clostridia bacterium]|nr:stage III sporulation protein AC [Clostridia bacterium]
MSYSVDIIFKIAAIGIIITVICQILKKSDRDDIATLVSLAGLVIVLALVISMISELFLTIKDLFGLY